MSKEAKILRKCVSCHDEHMFQKIKEIEGSCISGVSVLQKVTLNHILMARFLKQILANACSKGTNDSKLQQFNY